MAHIICPDLRDGLLADKIYKGYVGLRRNPFPAFAWASPIRVTVTQANLQ